MSSLVRFRSEFIQSEFFKRTNAQKLQSSVEDTGQFHLIVYDRDHQIGGHCDPYLRLHRVGTGAMEVVDPNDPALAMRKRRAKSM